MLPVTGRQFSAALMVLGLVLICQTGCAARPPSGAAPPARPEAVQTAEPSPSTLFPATPRPVAPGQSGPPTSGPASIARAIPSFTFLDNFANPATGWPVYDFVYNPEDKEFWRSPPPGPAYAHYLPGGGYGVNTVRAWEGRAYPSAARVASSTAFTVEADMRPLQDWKWYSSYGLFFNASEDLRQMYAVRIFQGSSPLQFQVLRWSDFRGTLDDPRILLADFKTCETCNAGALAWNHMLIRRHGDAFDVYLGPDAAHLTLGASIVDGALTSDRHTRLGFYQDNFEWASASPIHTYEFNHFRLAPSTSFVAVTGPGVILANTAAVFTATVFTEGAAFQPSYYRWEATGHSAVMHSSERLQDTISFSWGMTGTQAITVTAGNSASVGGALALWVTAVPAR